MAVSARRRGRRQPLLLRLALPGRLALRRAQLPDLRLGPRSSHASGLERGVSLPGLAQRRRRHRLSRRRERRREAPLPGSCRLRLIERRPRGEVVRKSASETSVCYSQILATLAYSTPSVDVGLFSRKIFRRAPRAINFATFVTDTKRLYRS